MLHEGISTENELMDKSAYNILCDLGYSILVHYFTSHKVKVLFAEDL